MRPGLSATMNMIETASKPFRRASSSASRSRARPCRFSRREQLVIAKPSLFEVSALERLRGGTPERDWPIFLARLEALGREGGNELVARAVNRGLENLLVRIHRYLSEERDALLRPVEESEARLRTLHKCARDAGQAAIEMR